MSGNLSDALSHARRACRRFGAARGGAAALEMALVAPILLLLLCGTAGLGLFITYVHEVQELASSASRAAVAGLTAADRDSIAQSYVAAAVANSALLPAGDVVCTTATSGNPATSYVVTITFSLQHTPVPVLAAFLGLNLVTVTRSSTIILGSS